MAISILSTQRLLIPKVVWAWGGALAISPPAASVGNSTVIFNGNVLFQNNAIGGSNFVAVGATLVNYQSHLMFNGQASFIGNSVESQGGLAVGGVMISSNTGQLPNGASLTFNQPSFFRNNTVTGSGSGVSMAGAVAIALGDTTADFNAPATFTGNQVIALGSGDAYGGAIAIPNGATVKLYNPQFLNNQVSAVAGAAKGGAFFIDNASVTIYANDPNKPVVFQGNTVSQNGVERKESIYLSAYDLRPVMNQCNQANPPQCAGSTGPAKLILDTAADALIDMQDGVSSDGGGLNSVTSQIEPNQIIKQGLGVWRQSGDARGYQDNTTIMAGTWQLQPGTVYGTTAKGVVTLMSGSNLVYNIDLAQTEQPQLFAKQLHLNGQVSAVLSNVLSATPGVVINQQAIAQADDVIDDSGVSLKQETTPLYATSLQFSSDKKSLLLSVTRTADAFSKAVEKIGGIASLGGLANTLDHLDASLTGELQALMTLAVNSSTATELVAVMKEMSGEGLTNGQSAIQGYMGEFNTQVSARLDGGALAYQMPSSQLASLDDSVLPAKHFMKSSYWGGWAQLMGSWGKHRAHDQEDGFRSSGSGLTVGFDHAWNPWRLGLALSTGRSVVDTDRETRTNSDTLAFSVYGAYEPQPYFVCTQIGAGRAQVSSSRNISSLSLRASSDYKLDFFNASASTGYYFHVGGNVLTPSIGLAYLNTHTPGYSESGAGTLNLQVDGANHQSLEAQINLELKRFLVTGKCEWLPRVSLGLAYELLDKQIELRTSFASFSNVPAFSTLSADESRLRAIVGVGTDFHIARNARLFLDYRGSFKPYVQNHMAMMSFKMFY